MIAVSTSTGHTGRFLVAHPVAWSDGAVPVIGRSSDKPQPAIRNAVKVAGAPEDDSPRSSALCTAEVGLGSRTAMPIT